MLPGNVFIHQNWWQSKSFECMTESGYDILFTQTID
ncbi:MAG: hypothetical protein RIR11_3579 [Bacteroidota bacterium]|jgi:hypothetical protein